ncbi:hypothetical protein CORC01_03621 [Colletotrichum orchidophilum]|uniref:Uncharacterized protein n=1 Tax=Colletotrichum orchidophilum TaxID=1209926 RepID=A0A1G4BI31_9PEZI|nr:uncharacterized protein CORC01_03621 [Colletotrichum orchidophilum]OHF01054.1 hypothetical protein CORC01_03621 [Colletotrichum orchidophilum]
MSTTKLLSAVVWFSGLSLPTRALAPRDDTGDIENEEERQEKGESKGKSKKGTGREGVPNVPATTPGLDTLRTGTDFAPVLGPGTNNRDPNNTNNGAPAYNEEPPPPPPPSENPQVPENPPNQEPPPPPPPPEEHPLPPPPPPSPETNAPSAPPPPASTTSVEARRSTITPGSSPVLSTSRTPVHPVSSSPIPVRSFPPPVFSQPSVAPPIFPQPLPRLSSTPELPQSSSTTAIIVVAPPPTSTPQTTSPPPAQSTDAGSRPPNPPAPAAPSSTSLTDQHGAMSGNTSQGIESNRGLVIALSTVLSVLAVIIIIIGTIFFCHRYRRGRLPFSRRGNSPIDDEEIESWKACRTIEKCTTVVVDKHDSAGPIRKPASVIVYQNQNQYQPRPSTDTTPPRSLYHKRSMDKKSIEIPQTPVLARAPNARVGLTDDTVEGDLAFLPSPKRQNSRLSKLPSPRRGRHRSSRSSASVGSLREHWYGYHTDTELSPRPSVDTYFRMPSSAHSDGKHQRVYSSPSHPPRLSLDEEYRMGGLSPRPFLRQSEIGLAVG